MSETDVFSGMVLRSATCKRCKEMLAVAVDSGDEEIWKNIRVRHKKGREHHVYYRDQELAIWRLSKDGWGALLEHNLILRVGKV